MRIAIAGKGGAGKTTLAATLARLAGADGRPVVLIDADSNPNLAAAAGIDEQTPDPLPPGLVSRRLDGPSLTAGLGEVLDEHAVGGPDGIRLARMGQPDHAEEGCLCAAHAVVSATLDDLGTEPGILTIVDLEASPEHLSRGTARHVDLLVLVAEPYFRSLETVRRMADLAAGLPIPRVGVVANKLRDERDREALDEFCDRHGLELIGEIPWSDRVLDADRDRVPLFEHDPSDPAVAAVRDLAGRLLAAGEPTAA